RAAECSCSPTVLVIAVALGSAGVAGVRLVGRGSANRGRGSASNGGRGSASNRGSGGGLPRQSAYRAGGGGQPGAYRVSTRVRPKAARHETAWTYGARGSPSGDPVQRSDGAGAGAVRLAATGADLRHARRGRQPAGDHRHRWRRDQRVSR